MVRQTISRVKDDRIPLFVGLLAGGVILVALAVRLIGLGAESGWIDEAFSVNLAQHSISQVIQGTAADQHPPLYYLILHFWLMLGNSVSNARLLSALLGLVHVIQVMVFGWKVAGRSLGIGAALLLAISPIHVWYSQEARQYMLLACLTTAATYELWQCLHGKKQWWAYWIFCSLAIYTQYFAGFIFLAHAGIVILWTFKDKNKHLIPHWVLAIIGVMIVFIPWTPTAINQFLYHTMSWISEPAAGEVRDAGMMLLLGNGIQVLPAALRWAGMFGLLMMGGWGLYRIEKYHENFRNGFRFFGLWLLIPYLSITIVSVFYPIFQYKQFLILIAPLMLLATLSAMVIPRPWGKLFFGGLVLAGVLTLVYQQSVLTKDNWQGAASYIEAHASADDMVYGNPAAISMALDLYWNSPLPFSGYPENYDILTGGWEGKPLTSTIVNEQLTKITQNIKRVWLIEFFPEFWDEKQLLPGWLEVHGDMLDEQSFGKIHLRLYELNP